MHKPAYAAHSKSISVGRITLPLYKTHLSGEAVQIRFANTRQTLAVMERVAACIRMVEPVLLVGETGTGKTTIVQQLARNMGKTMLVHNLSEQVARALARQCHRFHVS
jgi:midasin